MSWHKSGPSCHVYSIFFLNFVWLTLWKLLVYYRGGWTEPKAERCSNALGIKMSTKKKTKRNTNDVKTNKVCVRCVQMCKMTRVTVMTLLSSLKITFNTHIRFMRTTVILRYTSKNCLSNVCQKGFLNLYATERSNEGSKITEEFVHPRKGTFVFF